MLRPKLYVHVDHVHSDGAIHHDNQNGHNLYAKTFPEEFEEIRKFLAKNPSEIVIIDLNGDWFKFEESIGLNYDNLDHEIRGRFFDFKSMICDMSSISLETSYADLREKHNCNVIFFMRGDDKISKTYHFQISQFTILPFVVNADKVMAKTVSETLKLINYKLKSLA